MPRKKKTADAASGAASGKLNDRQQDIVQAVAGLPQSDNSDYDPKQNLRLFSEIMNTVPVSDSEGNPVRMPYWAWMARHFMAEIAGWIDDVVKESNNARFVQKFMDHYLAQAKGGLGADPKTALAFASLLDSHLAKCTWIRQWLMFQYSTEGAVTALKEMKKPLPVSSWVGLVISVCRLKHNEPDEQGKILSGGLAGEVEECIALAGQVDAGLEQQLRAGWQPIAERVSAADRVAGTQSSDAGGTPEDNTRRQLGKLKNADWQGRSAPNR